MCAVVHQLDHDFRFTMGRYPANTVAANIKDHYTVFVPLLNKGQVHLGPDG